MMFNWTALEADLKAKGINGLSMSMMRNLVKMTNKNPKFKGTSSPTATDARPLIREGYIYIVDKKYVHFSEKTLEILNK